jgi:hypothetical protein
VIQPAQRLNRTVLTIACLAGLALAAPAGAVAAGTVTLTGTDTVVVFNAAPGVANDVTVTTTADSVRISDAGDTITEAVDPCVNNGPNVVLCNGIFANWELAAGTSTTRSMSADRSPARW